MFDRSTLISLSISSPHSHLSILQNIFKHMTLTQEYALDQFYLSNYHLLPGGAHEVLQEGAIDIAKDAVQFAITAASEYGLSATIGGAPAGPIVETIVDTAFVAEGVASAALGAAKLAGTFGEMKDLMSNVLSLSLAEGFDSFYQRVLEIWQTASKYVGKAAIDKIDELVEQTQKLIKKAVTKLADAITDGLKLVIPDAIIGTGVAEGAEMLIKALAANAYTIITGVMKPLGKFTEIVINPAKTKEFFTEAFEWLESTLEQIIELRKEKPEGFAGAVTTLMKKTNPAIGVVNKIGDAALTALKSFISNNKDTVINAVVTVSKVLLPVLFGLLASYQILMKGEWKKEGGEEKSDEAQQESYAPEYLLKPTRDGKYLAAVSISNTGISSPLLEFKNKQSAVRWIRSSLLEMKKAPVRVPQTKI